MSTGAKQYYILSLKHSRGDFVTWWRSDCKGYTRFLSEAGLYNEDELEKKGLNNGESTLAVLCDDVLPRVRRVVFIDDIREVCKQPLYQVDGGLQTQKVFERENERLKKLAEERKQKIAAGKLCSHCDGIDGEHVEWCTSSGEADDD